MKKKLLLVTFVAMLSVTTATVFAAPKLESVSIATKQTDVTGDNKADTITLSGDKDIEPSPFYKNLIITIVDGATGKSSTIPLKDEDMSGFDPTMFVGDFTGDKISDIFVQSQTGGSGATSNNVIYSYKDGKPEEILSTNMLNKKYTYDVTYENQYKVGVISNANKQKYIIDISLRDKDSLSIQTETGSSVDIYYKNGNLRQPIKGFADPVSMLAPIDFTGDGVYELMAYQSISGLSHADRLGCVNTTISLKDGKLDIFEQSVQVYGTNIK